MIFQVSKCSRVAGISLIMLLRVLSTRANHRVDLTLVWTRKVVYVASAAVSNIQWTVVEVLHICQRFAKFVVVINR